MVHWDVCCNSVGYLHLDNFTSLLFKIPVQIHPPLCQMVYQHMSSTAPWHRSDSLETRLACWAVNKIGLSIKQDAIILLYILDNKW